MSERYGIGSGPVAEFLPQTDSKTSQMITSAQNDRHYTVFPGFILHFSLCGDTSGGVRDANQARPVAAMYVITYAINVELHRL